MAGTNYSDDKAAYNAQINSDITTAVDPNTVSPDMVGSGYTDLADLLEPYINRINDQDLYFGTDDPTSVPDFGQDLDLYYQQVNPIGIWRKEAGVWTLKGTIPIDFVLPEGNLTVQTNIDGFQVLATRGGWVISNTVYQKATQTLMTADAADLNFYRHDIVYGTSTNQVLYQVGIASASPVAPALPANTILIDEIIVPSTSSGFDPYLLFGGSGVNNLSPDDVILNQSGTPQLGASFNIDGSAEIGTSLTLTGIPTNAVSDFNLTIDALGAVRRSTTPVGTGLAAEASTGALTYAGISIVDASHVNIGACTGYVVDNESTPASPSVVAVNYAGELNKLVTTVGSGLATYVLLNSLGTIVFQNTFPTSAQRKTHIYLSKIAHPAGAITVAGNEVDFITSPLSQHRDLFQAINYINNGVTASAIGASLTFATSTGVVTGDGINFVADNTNPNDLTIAPQSPCTFLPRTQTGAGGAATTTVDVANYDVAGTVTAIPGGANVSTLRYIFLVPGLGYVVQYGQTTYASLTDAIAAVGREVFTIYPSLVRNSILIGVLAATKSATALNNTGEAQFFRADKFGQPGGSSAGVSTATLQNAYANSLQPQITTTTALGAVQFKRGSAADTDNVLQVLNGTGTANFSVTGNGLTTIRSGAEALKVGTNTGNPDHAYIGLYARTASPSTRSGLIGYENTASTAISIKNEITNGGIQLGTTGASAEVSASTNTLRVTPATSGTQNWQSAIGSVGTSNRISLETSLTTLTSGSIFRGVTYRGTSGSKTPVTANDLLSSLVGSGYLDATSTFDSALIQMKATQLWNSTDRGSRQEYYTTRNGTTTNVLAMTIDQDQSVGTWGGSESLKVGTNTGNPDHAYMGFYARTAAPTTRSGLLGYATAGSTALTLLNSLNNATIDLQTTGTSSFIRFLSPFGQFGGSNVRLDLGASSFASQTNMVLLDVSLADVTNGNKINGRTSRGSLATRAATLSGDSFLGIYGYGQHGVPEADTSAQASIVCSASENWSPTNRGAKWEVFTTPNASTTLSKAAEWANDGSFLYKFASAAADPTATEIPAGFVKLYKNTTSGVLKLWANDGGTLKSVTLT